jgi:thymidine kinase
MSLELILGPMFAGKTSALQAILRRHKALGIQCIAYKPKLDNRQGGDNYMYTHDGDKVSACITTELLYHRDSLEYRAAKLIIIEEGQFFPDLYQFVIKAVEMDKKDIVVAGLDGDRFRKPFGEILQLIPIADRLTKLTSLCKLCADGTPALFSIVLPHQLTQFMLEELNLICLSVVHITLNQRVSHKVSVQNVKQIL